MPWDKYGIKHLIIEFLNAFDGGVLHNCSHCLLIFHFSHIFSKKNQWLMHIFEIIFPLYYRSIISCSYRSNNVQHLELKLHIMLRIACSVTTTSLTNLNSHLTLSMGQALLIYDIYTHKKKRYYPIMKTKTTTTLGKHILIQHCKNQENFEQFPATAYYFTKNSWNQTQLFVSNFNLQQHIKPQSHHGRSTTWIS